MVPPHAAALLGQFGLAQIQPPRQNAFELAVSLGVEFVSTAVILTVLGAIVLAVAPDFTGDGVRYLHDEPTEAFLSGLVAFVATVVAMFLLAITVVGLVIVVPLGIVLVVLGVGATTVSVIALGSWIRTALDGGAATGHGAALLIGAIIWAAAEIVPILGGLVTFVVGTMGYGYLVLWVANRWFGRDYGSLGGNGTGPTDAPRARNRSPRDPADSDSDPATGDTDDRSDTDDWDDPDRFRNIAAVDAEREEREAAETSESTETAETTESTETSETSGRDEDTTDRDESSK